LKVMEEAIAMVDDRKKNRVGVVKPALVFVLCFVAVSLEAVRMAELKSVYGLSAE